MELGKVHDKNKENPKKIDLGRLQVDKPEKKEIDLGRIYDKPKKD